MRLQGTIYHLPNFWTTCSSIAAHPGQNVPFYNTGSDYTNKAFCAESMYLVLMKVIIRKDPESWFRLMFYLSVSKW